MTTRAAPPARLAALDGLRGALAVIVVLWHATSPLDWPAFAIPAKLAVSGFFVMSGLVLTRGWDGRPLAFLLSRAVRLWPTYALCLAAGYGLARTAPDLRLFLFFPLLDPDAPPDIDPPVWSLIVEAWAAPLMPLIVWAGRERLNAGLTIALALAAGRLDPDVARQQLWLALGLFVAGAHLSRFKFRSRLLETAPLQWLGRISYSLYLSHWLVFAAARAPLGPWGGLYALPFAFPVAWTLWFAVERSSVLAARALKARLARAGAVTPALP